MFGQRILILIPHPDDEVVACAAAIGRAKKAGAKIFAFYLTSGCPASDELWPWQRPSANRRIARRRAEGERAAEKLGIMPAAWSSRPARHLWRQLSKALHEAENVIARCRIDQIWVPAYEGGNADHDGLNAIGAILSQGISVLEFAEYNWLGGTVNSQSFPYPSRDVQTIILTEEEQRLKRQCLEIYESERRNLSYVATTQESFRPIARYDYSKPPHPGLLWYMRFHWTPFPHPGIDFSTSSMVCKAITCLLQDGK